MCRGGVHCIRLGNEYSHLSYHRFDRDDSGIVRVQFKNWSTDMEWLPKAQETPLQIYKVNDRGIMSLPTGEPQIVAPEYERKNTMKDIEHNINSGVKKYLTNAQQDWWESFVEDPGSHVD